MSLFPLLFSVQVHPGSHISEGHHHHGGHQRQHEGAEDDHCQTHHQHHPGHSWRERLCQRYRCEKNPDLLLFHQEWTVSL